MNKEEFEAMMREVLKEELGKQVKSLRTELKEEISEQNKQLRAEFNEQFDSMKQYVDEKLKPIKSQLDETYQIVRGLEHSAEVNKAEHDKMSNDIARLQGDVTNLTETSKSVFEMYGEHEAEIRKLKRRPV